MDWVNETVSLALKRKKKKYLVTDWITPSGKIHLGSLRGVVLHDIVAKELNKKAPTVFQYGFDDYDPMDGIPIYVDQKKYRPHFGKPLSEIPSPVPGYASFGEYYAKDFLYAVHAIGTKPKIEWTSKLYQSGKFDEAIKIVLKNSKKINELWQKIAKSKRSNLPIDVICGYCGSIFHTKALSWDGKKVTYSCINCKNRGARAPFGGGAKLPWRVEWAAKWWLFGSDVEGAGKDHNTKGGSHDVASAIAREVFKIDVPVNIVYEFFLFGGRKMSSSKAVGAFASDIVKQVPPELIRFLMETARPNRQINFDPSGDTIPRLFDDFDKTQKDFRFRFNKIIFLAQMPHVDIYKLAEQEKKSKLTASEKIELKKRIEYAKIWFTDFATENDKFTIQQKLPQQSLSKEQKEFLLALASHFKQEKSWQGEILHTAIHDVKNHIGIRPAEAFQAIYKIFLNKSHGPQAGWFLAALDRKFVLDRLAEASR